MQALKEAVVRVAALRTLALQFWRIPAIFPTLPSSTNSPPPAAFALEGIPALGDAQPSASPATSPLASLSEILDGFVFMGAVPKRRTTWRKARLRMQNKWLKPIAHIGTCPACQRAKLSHHVCLHCVRQMRPKIAEIRVSQLNITPPNQKKSETA
eukprot:m.26337 g.26337  ORF g.26337 m.26337 type:complete len:155 (-) comp38460_c0_seq2:63-527(-)